MGDSSLGERFPAWTRGNAADVFPAPFSPLGKDLVLQQSMSMGLRNAYISLGALSYRRVRELPIRPTCSRCSAATSTTRSPSLASSAPACLAPRRR